MYIIPILAVLLGIYQVESCQQGYFTSSTDNKSCCELCPAGSFMKKECDDSTRTKCARCSGNTYTRARNKQLSCDCCDCPDNMYWDTILLRCTECTKCESGQKLIVPCGKKQNSQCETCKQGTYLRGNECVACSICKKGETVMHECSSSQNTVCEKVVCPSPIKMTTKQLSQQVKTTLMPVNKTVTPQPIEDGSAVTNAAVKDTGQLTTTEWSLMVVTIILVLLLVSIIIILWIKLHKVHQGTAIPEKIGSKKGKFKVSAPKSPTVIIKENNMMCSDIRADITENLGLLLNAGSGKNWKHLAGLMGYGSTHTQNWELTPTEATQKLLHDWCQHSGSTVFKLYSYLKQLGRDDAACLLIPLLTDQVSVGELV